MRCFIALHVVASVSGSPEMVYVNRDLIQVVTPWHGVIVDYARAKTMLTFSGAVRFVTETRDEVMSKSCHVETGEPKT